VTNVPTALIKLVLRCDLKNEGWASQRASKGIADLD
jgi:hypothetical protein